MQTIPTILRVINAIKVEIRITKEEIMTIKVEEREILRKRDLFAYPWVVTNQRENHQLIKSLLMEVLGILCLSVVALGISLLKLFLQIWLIWWITLLNSVTHNHSLVVHNLLSMDHRCHNLSFVLLSAQFHSHNVNNYYLLWLLSLSLIKKLLVIIKL